MNRFWRVGSLLLLLSIFYFLFSNGLFAQTSQEERQKLEQQLADLENQIAQYESILGEYKKQGKTLQSEIDKLNAQINKTNLQIKAINLTLDKLDKEITENKSQIKTIEEKIELNRSALAHSLRILYEHERLGLMAVMLKNPRLSDFFSDVNNLLELQNSLAITVAKILELKNELVEETEALALKYSDAAELKAYQDAQRKMLASVKKEKDTLLRQTKGQESKYQSLIKESQKTAAEIRKQIFQFFGGGEMSFEEAYRLAKLASQATGVRAAFILAILDKESALGQSVGRCSYEKAMHPTRDLPIFFALLAKLKEAGTAPPEPVLVSCPNRDGAYGGAMGPAQFIPSTWNLYAARIAELTGHNPASPWNNGDAIMGTALYIKDAMRGCDAIYSRQSDIERCAAAKYYAGSRWRSHLWGYGDRVMTKARKFQSDIDILNS